MKDFHTDKRRKQLKRMQGLPTVGDIIVDLTVGTFFFAAIIVLYFVVKMV
jgi:hypothetical protein